MISIIVPVYNVENYLHECIDSIINQTYRDWELILVDDGSKDKSGDICDKYSQKDSRIKVFHKTNGGVSSARNVGLEHANGEWIAFVDADDWLASSYLLSLMKIKDVEMIVCGYKVNQNMTHSVTSRDFIVNIRDLDSSEVYFNETFFFPWRRLYLRDIIQKHNIKFDDALRLSEDTCFTCEYLIYCNTIAYINKCYYHHRSDAALDKYKISCEDFLYYTKALNKSLNSLYKKKSINTNKLYALFEKTFFAYYYENLKHIRNKIEFIEETKYWKDNDIFSFLYCLFNSRTKSFIVTYLMKNPILGYYFFKIMK